MYASIDDLRSQLGAVKTPEQSAAYRAKMLHALPEMKVVTDRITFVLEHVRGKRVLDIGASGVLSERVREAAATYFGVDRLVGPGVFACDLDDVERGPLPQCEAEFILCGEVLEHLGNPLWFLTRLHRQYSGVPVLVTVPNAFSEIAQRWIKKGYENVNADHVAWYSPKTLSVLLARAGYSCADLYYYNGSGPTAEGLIVVAE